MLLLFFSAKAQQENSNSLQSRLSKLEIPRRLKQDEQFQTFWVIGNLDKFPDHSLRIFDKSGKLVFKAKPYCQNWPIQKLPDSKYFFIIDLQDKRVSGWVEVIKELAVVDLSKTP